MEKIYVANVKANKRSDNQQHLDAPENEDGCRSEYRGDLRSFLLDKYR